MGWSAATVSICWKDTITPFTIRLPVERLQADTEAVTPTDPPGVSTAMPQRSGRVLYVEDNLANAELMRGFMAQRPLVELDIQRTAQDGLAAALHQRPDIILLDMRLPDLPGLDLLKRLKQDLLTAAIPVVVVSASAMADTVAEASAAGAVDYLAKPLRMATLLATVDRWLSPKSQPGEC